jgi:hypothetical protein
MLGLDGDRVIRPATVEDLPAAADLASDLLCREQSIWFEQSMLLGSRADMEDIARAFEKVHEHRNALHALAVINN